MIIANWIYEKNKMSNFQHILLLSLSIILAIKTITYILPIITIRYFSY